MLQLMNNFEDANLEVKLLFYNQQCVAIVWVQETRVAQELEDQRIQVLPGSHPFCITVTSSSVIHPYEIGWYGTFPELEPLIQQRSLGSYAVFGKLYIPRMFFVEEMSARTQAHEYLCCFKSWKIMWPDCFLRESKTNIFIWECPRLFGYLV